MKFEINRWIAVVYFFLLITGVSPLHAVEQYLQATGSDVSYVFDEGGLKRIERDGVTVFSTLDPDLVWKLDFLKMNFDGIKKSHKEVCSDALTVTRELVTSTPDLIYYRFTLTDPGPVIVHVRYTRLPDNSNYANFITVENNMSDEPGADYRLMQVHFPFIRMGNLSWGSQPDLEDCYLSMDSYVIKNPGSIINPTYPDYFEYTDPNTFEDFRLLWHGTYGYGESLPFHLFYNKDTPGSEAINSFYAGVYNTYGYPCEVNFYKHFEDPNSDGSFYLDIVQYPNGDVLDEGNDMLFGPDFGRPGLYIETGLMDGDWYEAALHYRNRTEALSTLGPAPSPYDSDPIWTTTPLRDRTDFPDWIKKCPMVYYISPQISADDYNYKLLDETFPMYERAAEFKRFMYITGQLPQYRQGLSELFPFVVKTWPWKPISPQVWPEFRGGYVPMNDTLSYATYAFQNSKRLMELWQDTLNLKLSMTPGANYWNSHPLYNPTSGYPEGNEQNGDWGFDLQIQPEPDNYTYQGLVPRPPGYLKWVCKGTNEFWNGYWHSYDDPHQGDHSNRSIMYSLTDPRDATTFFGGDSLYMGAFGHTICLGDYTQQTTHAGHPRDGSNWNTYGWFVASDFFQSRYSGEEKVWISEVLGEIMMSKPVVIATALFPPVWTSPYLHSIGSGTSFSADRSFQSYTNFVLREVNEGKDEIRHYLDNIIPEPIFHTVMHDKIPIFDGISGWITGTFFHGECTGMKIRYKWDFYRERDGEPMLPLRSLCADMAVSYVRGDRFIIEDVDTAEDDLGIPLSLPAPTPDPAATPVVPDFAYSFLDDPYHRPARNYLRDILASYVTEGKSQWDKLYHMLFMGRLMKPIKLATVFWPSDMRDIAYDLASGNSFWEDLGHPIVELDNLEPVFCSAFNGIAPDINGNYNPVGGERVAFTFANYTEKTYTVNIRPVNLKSYFSDSTLTYRYFMIEYHQPGSLYPGQSVNPENFRFPKPGVTVPAYGVKTRAFYRVPGLTKGCLPYRDGFYVDANADEWPDFLEHENRSLRIVPGVENGLSDVPVTLSDLVDAYQCYDLNSDKLTDFICLNNHELQIYMSSGDFNYTLVRTISHDLGHPKILEVGNCSGDNVRLTSIFEDSVYNIDISGPGYLTSLKKLIGFDVTIEKVELNYIDDDTIKDVILTTSDNILLGIKGESDSMTEILEIPLPSDVELSGLDDVDNDGDFDIVLENSGKDSKPGGTVVLTNVGEWKFK